MPSSTAKSSKCDKWDLSVTASNIRNELGGCRVVLNKLHYLKVGKRYEISGNYYDVTEINGKEVFFAFVGHNILIPSSFSLIKPKFFHGTIISTNNELKDIQNWRDKLPLMYLYEILTEYTCLLLKGFSSTIVIRHN